MLKAQPVRSIFGSRDVEKVHACARCCAKHIWKSECSKHNVFGALVAVEMLNKCTTFGAKHMWKSICESRKHTRFGALLADVEKLHAAVARSTFGSQNAKNKTCSDHFRRFRCRKSARHCGVKLSVKSECEKHHIF